MTERTQALPPYQYAVKRLTAENRRLRAELAALERAHKRETRVLRAQLDEGLTPELTALRRQERHWRERAVRAEGRLASARRSAA
jgi:hypothetical protein